MQNLSDQEFDALISRAMDDLPKRDIENLDNVAVTYADEPSQHQIQKLKLRGDHLLLGLYEGIPMTRRGSGYNLVLPDKITLFKLPILTYATMRNEPVYDTIKHTLWHEIAHFYGLDHSQIHNLEK